MLISGLGFFLQLTEWGEDSQKQVLSAIGEYASPAVQQSVAEMLNNLQEQAAIGGPVGLVTLLFTAAALFAQFDRAFDRIWNVPTREPQGIWETVKNILFERLRAFLLLLGVGALILVIFVTGVALSSARRYAEGFISMNDVVWRILETTVSVVLNSGAFCLIFKLLPKVPVKWSKAYQGELLTAVIWELGRLALTWFLVGDKYSAYGVVGSFIAVMLWIY